MPALAIVIAVSIAALALALVMGRQSLWSVPLWLAIFGLAVWSYGFNNFPLIRPIPLVDALVVISVALGFRKWWELRKEPVVRRLLFLLSILLVVVFFRLMVDIPRYGLLASRDALFAFELWVIFPAIALGYTLGEERLDRRLLWLFGIATLWFLLYPWRDTLTALSPVFGIQRPVPLFAFTTAGFLSVPAFFWFLWHRGRLSGVLWAACAVLILLMVQGRGAYLAWFTSMFLVLLLHGRKSRLWSKVVILTLIGGLALLAVGGRFTGRVGEPVTFHTVVAQLETLIGKEGPGAGSFLHRLAAWPTVIDRVLSEPLGPVFGVGLGPDLFQGFALGPDILVRKPHNDFLEIWARLGVVGLLPWLSFLVVLGWAAFKGARRDVKQTWILALQITLWITSFGQPAMGFAYVTVVWAALSGLWIGARLHEEGRVYAGG